MGAESEETQTRNLADIILAKIAMHEAGESDEPPPEDRLEDEVAELPPKVQEVYTKFVADTTLVLSVANAVSELAIFFRDTNLANYLKLSKSSQPSHQQCKMPLSLSLVPRTGLHTLSMKQLKSSFRALLRPHNPFSLLLYSNVSEKTCMRIES
jgi:hypothetical protein